MERRRNDYAGSSQGADVAGNEVFTAVIEDVTV